MKTAIVLGFAVLAAAAACALYAAGTVSERNALSGVQPFRPAVDKMPAEALAAGVDAKKLRVIIQDRLKTGNVPVDANGANDLSLAITTSAKRDGLIAVHLHLEAKQLVALFHEYVRDPESRMFAPTWSASWTGILKPEEMKQLDDELAKLVDLFIADWKVGNLGRR